MDKLRILPALPLLLAMTTPAFAMDIPGVVDEVSIQTKTVGKVRFGHMQHGLSCEICHPKIFVQKNNANHVDMKAMAAGKSCGACHNGKQAFSVSGDCDRCHAGDLTFKGKSAGNATFSHSVHNSMFACADCHPTIFKAERSRRVVTMTDMKQGGSCGACHNGDKAFSVTGDCEKCHKM